MTTEYEFALSRRRVLGASLAAGTVAAARTTPLGAALRVTTPPQTSGPFYPATKPLDQDNDLTRVAGKDGRAEGKPIHIVGQVLGRGGRPAAGARVEIWQCNAFGRYHHPRDSRDVPLDPFFQGWGRNLTGDDGAYRFMTIEPPPYPASTFWMRPAHVHFAVSGRGFEPLVTQMYFAGDPHLERDRIFNGIADPAARASVVVTLAPPVAELSPAAEVAVFDIVLARLA